MEEVLTHLINQAYRVYQGKLIPEISKPTNISYYLEFGGFQLSYNTEFTKLRRNFVKSSSDMEALE